MEEGEKKPKNKTKQNKKNPKKTQQQQQNQLYIIYTLLKVCYNAKARVEQIARMRCAIFLTFMY